MFMVNVGKYTIAVDAMGSVVHLKIIFKPTLYMSLFEI